MKILVLTSSRADYGIYQPLLRRMDTDSFFDMEVVAFGTHLSRFHGYTLQGILDDGYSIARKMESLVFGDSEEAISSAMALTAAKFSGFWADVKEKYDLIFCLGDRYEMFAAVSAGIPFNLTFAHIHGGEETLGAIDNIFRHCITHMSTYHFTTTESYKRRVLELLGSVNKSGQKVYNVGSLSLDNLEDIQLLNASDFLNAYGIDVLQPTILFTFHPETVGSDRNKVYIEEIVKALEELIKRYQIIVTMPNADTQSTVIRKKLKSLAGNYKEKVHIIESFGTRGYFSCMNQVLFLMGNSSSGIIEAASFGKWVINLGDRQKGRESGTNVMDVNINQQDILSAVGRIEKESIFDETNIYWNGGAANKIIKILKKDFGNG